MTDIDVVVVLCNGPPRSGKDEIAKALRKLQFQQDRFSAPLKAMIPAMLGVTHEELEVCKDEPHPAIAGGLTYRQLQISLSETWFKPNFGDDIFGVLLADRIARKRACDVNRMCSLPTRFVIPDSGFLPELAGLVDMLSGHRLTARLLVIHTSRPGCDFSIDSRGYLSAAHSPWQHVYFWSLANDQGLKSWQDRAVSVVLRWFDKLGV
jgi:hypothetical protein